jgi:3-isopropylmalate dehydrogenase
VDACALHLISKPKRFDVILTENLFGDILSDEAAAISGSMGMLGSATIGGKINIYEPVHGSSPDIAGKDVANPLGAIASVAMLLRYSAGIPKEAAALEAAIQHVLDAGHRTPDISGTQKQNTVGTKEMGRLVEQAFMAMLDQTMMHG